MSKNKTTIAFTNIYQLWDCAKKIKASYIEIVTAHMLLICDCSETDLEIVSEYGGYVVEEDSTIPDHKFINHS